MVNRLAFKTDHLVAVLSRSIRSATSLSQVIINKSSKRFSFIVVRR